MSSPTIESFLVGHGYGDLEAAVWARFLETVICELRGAQEGVSEPSYWREHVAKRGALSRPRKIPGGGVRRFPSEEGLTSALAHLLRRQRGEAAPGSPLRTMEIQFSSEERMISAHRTGKNSRRFDLVARSTIDPDAPMIIFEAKCLASDADVANDYLGAAGLGCFVLPPEPYPAERLAGLLAYTTDGTSEDWHETIMNAMTLMSPPTREHLYLGEGVTRALWSRLDRPSLIDAKPLAVFHMVMRFQTC